MKINRELPQLIKILMVALFTNPKLLFKRLLTNERPEEIKAQELYNLDCSINSIIEAGFYDGKDTKELAYFFPEAQIIALEPNKHMFLKANHQKNVVYLNNCLTENSLDQKPVEFYQSNESPSSSLLKPTYSEIIPTPKLHQTEIVIARSILSLMREFNLESIDLLWLDLQGYEKKIIQDLIITKQINKIKYILTEVSRIPLYESSGTYKELDQLLLGEGFRKIIQKIPLVSGNILYGKLL